MGTVRSALIAGFVAAMPLLLAGCGQPTVDAGVDQTVQEGTEVMLTAVGVSTGSASALDYFWEQMTGPTVDLGNTRAQSVRFAAPDLENQTSMTFQVTMWSTIGRMRFTEIDTVSVHVLPNPPPLVNAGVDVTVTEGNSVALAGQATMEVPGVSLELVWRQASGPLVNILNATKASASFTAPGTTETTTLEFVLTATADAGNSGSDTVVVTVEPQPPRADAGDDQTVTENDVVDLDASGSVDPDDGVLSFLWEQLVGPEVLLSSDITAEPFFTAPPVDVPTLLRFEITVTSEDGVVDSDVVDVQVVPFGEPTALISGDQVAYESHTVNLSGVASSDPAGSELTYQWEVLQGSVTLSSLTAQNTSFTAPTYTGDTDLVIVVGLTVRNEEGLTGSTEFPVTVQPYPDPRADAGPDQTVDEGDTVILDGSGSTDPLSGAITYEWTPPAGVTLSDTSATKPTFTAPSVDADTAYTLTLRVTNVLGDSTTDTVVITVLNGS